jgi:hypothetical protein
MSEPKFVVGAKRKLSEAIEELRHVQKVWGRGAGGREVSLAVTNAEQAELWLDKGRKEAAEASTPDPEEEVPSGPARAYSGRHA